MELLTHALSRMTAVEYINLNYIRLPSAKVCDMLMEALVANRAETNPALKKISL